MQSFKIFFFGMITVSSDVRIVNVFVFHYDLSSFEQHSRFPALCNVFRAISTPHLRPLKSEGARIPVA